MTTHVSHWTTSRSSHPHGTSALRLHRLAVPRPVVAPPVGILTLVATIVTTKLAMLTAIIWASPTLAASTVLATLDFPLVITVLALLSWVLLASSQTRGASSGAEDER